MTTSPSKLIVIPPVRETAQSQAMKKQLRVAAYCRVSTDDEEQFTSYEAQVICQAYIFRRISRQSAFAIFRGLNCWKNSLAQTSATSSSRLSS